MADINVSDLLLIVIAIFLPPICALLTDGCGAQFCINVILTILGFIPGLIHAIWLVYRQANRRDLSKAGHGQGRPGHYVVVNQPGQQYQQPHHGHHYQQPQQGYGVPAEAAHPAQPVQYAPPQSYGQGSKVL